MRLVTSLIAMCAAVCCAAFPSDITLWYQQPASCWQETLPLGNGRLGMMPDGGIDNEKIVLNEISMWSGSEADYSNVEASKSLPQIQKLLKEGKNKEAQDLMYSSFVPSKGGSGATYGCYQMLGDLDIQYYYKSKKQPADYVRWLDVSEALAGTSFQLGDVKYTREYCVPRGSDFMVVHISADHPRSISLTARISRPERGATSASGDALYLSGNLDSGADSPGVGYTAVVKVFAHGAKVRESDGCLSVKDADEAWVLVTARTDYFDKTVDTHVKALADFPKNSADIFELRRRGLLRYKKLFNRAGISLPSSEISSLPTDERLRRFVETDDPQLAALYYNYGRYLLISSTLPGLLPPNLQGLWANECGTPWNGDYHTNINVQMNHWPVEQTNLSELHMPLVDLTCRAVPSGQRTARAFYGPKAKGWVMHMMTNVWNYTEPGEHPSWGATNTGGAWLCAHLWEHYLFNPADTSYLRRIYPVMKGASEFFMSTMITEPKHGWLVTAPSSSPENEFYDPNTGVKVSVCMGPTMDNQLIAELFGNVVAASEILGCDKQYASELRNAISRLPKEQIGSDGRLMEWMEEYRETDVHHRHVSHLYGLHPGNRISVINTPEIAEACRKTLDTRGDEGTGWSRAWKINFWARLADGDRAYRLFRSLLTPAIPQGAKKHGSGTFPNLFCSHPPFQIDGNFGGTSGISEMLVQSQDGFVNLLPAIPQSWTEGEVHGFKVRGGATVDMSWRDLRPVSATITVPAASPLRVLVPQGANVRIDGLPARVTDRFVELAPGATHNLAFEYRL